MESTGRLAVAPLDKVQNAEVVCMVQASKKSKSTRQISTCRLTSTTVKTTVAVALSAISIIKAAVETS